MMSRAFLTILGVEAAERAAWFGVLSLLPLQLATRAFVGSNATHVAGLDVVRQVLQTAFGPLAPAALASLVFGSFTGCAYVTPLVGALIADRRRRRRITIFAGLALSTAGCALLATEAGLLVGLALLVLGAGGVKANLLAQVGALDGRDGAPRRFAIYLGAVNVGALSGPLLCGGLAQAWGWRAGFLAATAILGGATGLYLWGHRGGVEPSFDAFRREADGGLRLLEPASRRWPIAPLAALLVPYVLFYIAYNQAFDLLPVWASTHVDLALGRFHAPVAWFYTVDGVFTIVAALAVARLWRGAGPNGVVAIAVACGLCATAYVGLGFAAQTGRTPLLAMIGFFAALDAGLPLIEASTLARLGRLAPAGAAGTSLALTSLAFAAADFGAGAMGALYPHLSPTRFWWLQACVAASGGAVMLAARRRSPSMARLAA